jgi:Ser/Thr protein kinase RdoA (MazF antagonist)
MYISEIALKKGAELFAYDLDALNPTQQGGMPEGAVYEYTDGEDQLFVKIVPVSADYLPAVRDRFDFISYLDKNGLGVPILLPSINGTSFETVSADDQLYIVTKMKKSPGRQMVSPNDWDDQFFEAWGRVLGKLHSLSKHYEGGTNIPDWQCGTHDFFADTLRSDKDLSSRWEQFGEELKQIPISPDAFGLIHNDAGSWNLLYDGSTARMIDFEVCVRHWFIYEIATALFYGIEWLGHSNEHFSNDEVIALINNFKQHFLAGYFSENTLDDSWFEYIPFFAKYRRVMSYIAFANMAEQSGDERIKKQAAEIRESILEDKPVLGLETNLQTG